MENQDINENTNNIDKLNINNTQDDDNDDVNFETLQKEMNDNGMQFEFINEEDLGDIIYDDDLEELKQNNIQEDESLNDEDYKKMLERKKLIEVNAFQGFEAEGEIYSVALDEKNKVILVGDGEEYFYRLNLEDNSLSFKEKTCKDSIISIKYSFDKSIFLVASMDGQIKIYDGTDLKLIVSIEDNSDEILWTDWHPKGLVFAIGTSAGAAFVYDAKSGTAIKSLYGHNDACSAGSFSLDGKMLLTASNDKTVKVWELKTSHCKYTIRGNKYHKADILCMAIAKTKSLVATGSGFNELGIVNYDNGNVSKLRLFI